MGSPADAGRHPRAIIDQLHRAVVAAADAELKARLTESGIELASGSPEELQQAVAGIKLHA